MTNDEYTRYCASFEAFRMFCKDGPTNRSARKSKERANKAYEALNIYHDQEIKKLELQLIQLRKRKKYFHDRYYTDLKTYLKSDNKSAV
jgi:hypothetical protein